MRILGWCGAAEARGGPKKHVAGRQAIEPVLAEVIRRRGSGRHGLEDPPALRVAPPNGLDEGMRDGFAEVIDNATGNDGPASQADIDAAHGFPIADGNFPSGRERPPLAEIDRNVAGFRVRQPVAAGRELLDCVPTVGVADGSSRGAALRRGCDLDPAKRCVRPACDDAPLDGAGVAGSLTRRARSACSRSRCARRRSSGRPRRARRLSAARRRCQGRRHDDDNSCANHAPCTTRRCAVTRDMLTAGNREPCERREGGHRALEPEGSILPSCVSSSRAYSW